MNSILKKYNLKALSCSDILFFIALTNATLWRYVGIVLSHVPFIGVISNVLTIAFILVLILFSIPKYLKILKPIDYLFYIACFTIFISQYIFHPENQLYLDEIAITFLFNCLPFYLVGRIINYDRTKHFITLLSVLSIASFVILRYVLGNGMTEIKGGDMYAAYTIMPFVILMILDSFKTHNFISIITSLFSFILLLSLGNRGSVLYTTIFMLICIMNFLNKKSVVSRIFVLILMIIMVYFFIGVFLENIYTRFEEIGVSTRVFDMMDDEGINTSGRDYITHSLLTKLGENYGGYGLMGDRLFIGTYSHNIILEILFSFGYIMGGIIVLVLIVLLVKAYIKCRNSNVGLFYLALICFGILPLMTSDSFLKYPFFFLLLGYAVQINNVKIIS